jgi:hypothetical protein
MFPVHGGHHNVYQQRLLGPSQELKKWGRSCGVLFFLEMFIPVDSSSGKVSYENHLTQSKPGKNGVPHGVIDSASTSMSSLLTD